MKNESLCIALRYLGVTAFVALFGIIYEHFSFGVYSPYMICAFLYPLVFGVFPWTFLAVRNSVQERHCHNLAEQLIASGIATLTTGSLVRGILDIYGTTNGLTAVYIAAGAALLVIGYIILALPHAITR